MKKKNCIEVKSTRRRLDISTFKVLMVRQRLRILKYTIITLIYNSQQSEGSSLETKIREMLKWQYVVYTQFYDYIPALMVLSILFIVFDKIRCVCKWPIMYWLYLLFLLHPNEIHSDSSLVSMNIFINFFLSARKKVLGTVSHMDIYSLIISQCRVSVEQQDYISLCEKNYV